MPLFTQVSRIGVRSYAPAPSELVCPVDGDLSADVGESRRRIPRRILRAEHLDQFGEIRVSRCITERSQPYRAAGKAGWKVLDLRIVQEDAHVCVGDDRTPRRVLELQINAVIARVIVEVVHYKTPLFAMNSEK